MGFAFLCSNISGLFQDRIFIDSSLFFIELISMVTVVFISATTIIKDVLTKEVYYILSRPISKYQFIVGRFIGSTACALILYLLINVIFYILILIYNINFQKSVFFYYFVIGALKMILISSTAFIFSTYSTSFFPSIILTLMCLTAFEFVDSLSYWITIIIENTFIKSIYSFFISIVPNFANYDIFYIYDFTKFGSLSNYIFFLFIYTIIYSLIFLIISLITFKNRNL